MWWEFFLMVEVLWDVFESFLVAYWWTFSTKIWIITKRLPNYIPPQDFSENFQLSELPPPLLTNLSLSLLHSYLPPPLPQTLLLSFLSFLLILSPPTLTQSQFPFLSRDIHSHRSPTFAYTFSSFTLLSFLSHMHESLPQPPKWTHTHAQHFSDQNPNKKTCRNH